LAQLGVDVRVGEVIDAFVGEAVGCTVGASVGTHPFILPALESMFKPYIGNISSIE